MRLSWKDNMRLLGYTIIGNPMNSIMIYNFKLPENEVNEMKLIRKEIQNCIKDDLIEACEEDIGRHNKNGLKWLKTLVREGGMEDD